METNTIQRCKECDVPRTRENCYVSKNKKSGKEYLFSLCKCCYKSNVLKRYHNDKVHHQKVRDYQNQYKTKIKTQKLQDVGVGDNTVKERDEVEGSKPMSE